MRLFAARAGFPPSVTDGADLVSDLYEDSGSMSAVFSAIHGSVSDIALVSAVLQPVAPGDECLCQSGVEVP